MGYEQVSGSMSEIQELKYGGEVNTERVIHTAADLVILHSELERIHDLVRGAVMENYRNMLLRDILEARSYPSDTLDATLRKSLTCSLQRLRNSKQPLFAQHSQAPVIPPRGHVPQRQQSAQLQLPAVQGQHKSLQHLQDDRNLLPSGRRSSAPDVQPSQLDRWVQPPLSPLVRQAGQPIQQHMPIPPPNSKDDYSNLDKTIDKSQGMGIDSVKYIPDSATIAGSPVAKGVSIPFDPSNLPEPAFDTHDLEMFHQETFNLEDSYVSGNMSLLINPRSTGFDDFSGPDLDDHLTFRSHDSGHMGLSESPQGSSIAKIESEQQVHVPEGETEHDEACTSSSHFGRITAPRVQDAQYEDVLPQEDNPPSSVSFQVGQNTSTDSQAPSMDTQSTQQPKTPVPQPRSHSGREKKLRESNEGSLPSIPSSDPEHTPIPRPRSHQNLQYVPSMKVSQVFESPPSPSRSKPAIKPRKGSPHNDRSNESSTTLNKTETTNKDISLEGTCISQPLPSIHECLTTEDGAPTSHITSMESSSSDNLQFEAQTSLESGSPHPSLESKPSMSNKSDPCSSTPSEEAPSACSGDKVFQESAVDSSLDSWVEVSIVEKDSKDALTSLTRPIARERAGAFSTKSVSDKLPKQQSTQSLEDCVYTTDTASHTDIQNAKPCWYCTNLTTLDICDVCGNSQKRETTV